MYVYNKVYNIMITYMHTYISIYTCINIKCQKNNVNHMIDKKSGEYYLYIIKKKNLYMRTYIKIVIAKCKC